MGLQILTTITRTNIEQTQGDFCNQQSNWIIVFCVRITGDTVERVFTPGTQGLDNQVLSNFCT